MVLIREEMVLCITQELLVASCIQHCALRSR